MQVVASTPTSATISLGGGVQVVFCCPMDSPVTYKTVRVENTVGMHNGFIKSKKEARVARDKASAAIRKARRQE